MTWYWKIEIEIETITELNRADIHSSVVKMLQSLGADGQADCSITVWESDGECLE